MRFHRVGSEVLGKRSAGAVGPRRRETGRASSVSHRARSLNRDIVMTFAAAWAADDRATMAALAADGITCRWTGFGSAAAEAVGLAEVIVVGREFERRHGRAGHYQIVETLGGVRHAAIMFEPGPGPRADHGARIAVYGLEGDRIASISVYGDRLD